MNTQKYDWHNPEDVDPSKLGEGWRFCLVSEIENPPIDAETWYNGQFVERGYPAGSRLDADVTYRTCAKLPANLPPWPEHDCTTHWWKYRGFGWDSRQQRTYAVFHPTRDINWRVFIDAPTSADSELHYIELLPISYADKDYLAYVKSEALKGRSAEWKGIHGFDPQDWTLLASHPDTWGSLDCAIIRLAPTTPQTEPGNVEVDYDSREHKLSVLAAWVLDGQETQLLGQRGEWYDEYSFYSVITALRCGDKVRIKPKPAPVALPLDNYRVSEAVKIEGVIHVITAVDGDKIHLEGREGWNASMLKSCGAKIHRNGQWVKCSKESLKSLAF